jgi:hypothetical protein
LFFSRKSDCSKGVADRIVSHQYSGRPEANPDEKIAAIDVSIKRMRLEVTKKRDAAYYEGRLKRDHPKEFAELRAGRFRSVRQAAAAVGLIHLPTRLDALKREWKRAGKRDRLDFIAWVRGSIVAVARGAPAAKQSIVDSAGHLKPAAIKFIEDWTIAKRIKPGSIMMEIGFKNYDATLAFALKRGKPVRSEVLSPLKDWMVRNGYKFK